RGGTGSALRMLSRLTRRIIDDDGANGFERSQDEIPIDDPGDAQRSSKSEPDGDGEEGPLNPGRGYPASPDLQDIER
ncbi:MAG: hypothetical protein ABIT64_00335, partial [Lysobacteraceae bacterium]